jgi:hypothetical protein
VVGEYVGGILLIVIMWIFVKTTRPSKMIEHVRERMREEEDEDGGEQEPPDWREMIRSKEGWGAVGKRYAMEWGMVWKDVTVGFTIAGVIAAFVPRTFFEWLFIGTGEGESLTFLHVLEHVLVGPVAAFMTFIGSMGNIPLAGVLYGHGVSVAGIMAFIFSDLVVFPVLRINAKYYGWKMAVYILLTLLVALVGAALIIHYGFAVSGLQPEAAGGKQVTEQDFFAVDYTLFLNIGFLAVSGILVWLGRSEGGLTAGMMSMSKGVIDRVLFYLSIAAYAWIAGGLLVLLIER